MAFLVRKGNPKHIHDWSDLVKSNVKLVFPNPGTSGNGRYTWLAAWGAISQTEGGDLAKTRQFMAQLLRNVVVFDIGGRGATTTFIDRGLGDVLISFESEVKTLSDRYAVHGYEVVVPKNDIMAEFPASWIDKNVERNKTGMAAKAYLAYLYSPAAQKIITGFYYRVSNPVLMAENKNRFPQTQLFKVEDMFGRWDKVMKIHFASGGELDKLLTAGH